MRRVKPAPLVWEDSSTGSYDAIRTVLGDLDVQVCLDDEGPMRPAYYWWIEDLYTGDPVDFGWESSVPLAKHNALATAGRWKGVRR